MRPISHLPFTFALLSIFSLSFCSSKTPTTVKEDFEGDKKGSYEKATVKLNTGEWRFDNAMIGSTEEDHKTGNQAVRLRDKGRITMNFDLTNGVSTVTIRHAAYGDDESSDWELWYSTTQGKSWQSAGPKVSTSQHSLVNTIFPLSNKGKVRFEVRKVSGGKARLNLDDFVVVPYGATSVKPEAQPTTPPVIPPVAKSKPGKSTTDPAALYLLLGNPSSATADLSNADNFLMVKPQYTLSYNRSKGIPNWVSWYIDKSWLGKVDRQNDFQPDKSLPAGWPRVKPTDYAGSGFDKGHVCPSADRQNTVANNSATFLMTNMVPQSPDNNRGPWEKLEAHGREMVGEGHELYIIAGTYGVGGEGSTGKMDKLKGKVTVPAHTWKVIVVLPNGEDDLSRINAKTRVISISVPNVQGIKSESWTKFKTSVDAIEEATGYDLLSNVPKAVQDVLEKKVD